MLSAGKLGLLFLDFIASHRRLNEAVEIRIYVCIDRRQSNLKLLLDNALYLRANLGAGHWNFRGPLDSLGEIAHRATNKV